MNSFYDGAHYTYIGCCDQCVYILYIENTINHTVEDILQKLSGWYISVYVTCIHVTTDYYTG